MKLLEKIALIRLQEEGEKVRSNRIYDDNFNATVGASDLTCAVKAAYSILYPPEFDLDRFIILTRGNVSESIFFDSFKYLNIDVETQRSYFGEKGTIFSHMKVHPDFVVFLDKVQYTGHEDIDRDFNDLIRRGKKIWLNEMKTSSYIPDVPHHYWKLQVMMQAGLIALEHGITPEQIDINLIVINLNTGKRRIFHFDWNEDIYYEGLEVSLAIQTFKEELIEMMSGERKEFTVAPEELPAMYNPGVCALCEYTDKCPIFKKQGTFNIGKELDDAILSYLDAKKIFDVKKEDYEANIRPVFEKLGRSGKGIKTEGKFTAGKSIAVLLSSDIPRDKIIKLAEAYPDAISIDTGRLKALDEVAFANLSKEFGTTKVNNQRLVVKRKKHQQ